MAEKTCENCERAIKFIKRKLLSYGREMKDLDDLRNSAKYPTPGLDASSVKIGRRIIFWRGLLEMFEPVPEYYTGIFPGKGRQILKKRRSGSKG